jgi:hypothetical protein
VRQISFTLLIGLCDGDVLTEIRISTRGTFLSDNWNGVFEENSSVLKLQSEISIPESLLRKKKVWKRECLENERMEKIENKEVKLGER